MVGSLSISFVGLFLAVSFVLVFAWSFLIYDRNLIQEYFGKKSFQGFINDYINDLNEQHGSELQHVDIESQTEEEYRGIGQLDRKEKRQVRGCGYGVAGYIFASTIALGTNESLLIMCEIFGSSGQQTRFFWFKVTLCLLVINLTVVQPFVVFSLIICQEAFPRHCQTSKKINLFILYVLWFFLLHKCGDTIAAFSWNKSGFNARSLLERKINEISVAGITIMSAFSGIGCAITSYDVIKNPILSKRSLAYNTKKEKFRDENEVNALIQKFNHTTLLLSRRENQHYHSKNPAGGSLYSSPNVSSDNLHARDHLNRFHDDQSQTRLGNILYKVRSFASLSSLSLSKTSSIDAELQQEVDSLKNIRKEFYKEIVEAVFALAEQRKKSKRPFIGAELLSLADYAICAYCIYRVVYVLLVELPFQHWTEAQDPLAVSLAKVYSFFKTTSSDDQTPVHAASLLISISLFFGCFSQALRAFSSAASFLPSISSLRAEAKSALHNLLLSQLLGLYVISTLHFIRSSLPSNLSHQITSLLSMSLYYDDASVRSEAQIEVSFIDRLSDCGFAFSVISIALVLLFHEKFLETPDDEYSMDEETLIDASPSQI
ncbi:Piso0_004286 [Millerozyma farinosa CBS 7064]|uniref:Piso0_004286 protein n=1 Tax=Pichia sorbitophila (strain ATCC MYA-4447 / BCRC 22081 / CBS 7064 / NBRC 10061 / NRRL Y-12695) TaxID=559304 RepID=G8YB36_PICSO|nr:Piso0_004286 [Millerozyma farinosa CBS 7064]CCE84731.1 Piso0_004286 [Millerozyma farinosa CBS 7064]